MRVSNSLKYTSPVFGRPHGEAMCAVGNQAGSIGDRRVWASALAYTKGLADLVVSYRYYDGGSVMGGVISTAARTRQPPQVLNQRTSLVRAFCSVCICWPTCQHVQAGRRSQDQSAAGRADTGPDAASNWRSSARCKSIACVVYLSNTANSWAAVGKHSTRRYLPFWESCRSVCLPC